MQVKLLRVTRQIDVRNLAATHRSLAEDAEFGAFPHDLYYRLKLVALHMPPLRERGADILPLAQYLLASLALRLNRKTLDLASVAVYHLMHAAWPGNVQELENAMERAVALALDDQMDCEDLPKELFMPESNSFAIESCVRPLLEIEKNYILAALAFNGGNQTHTAEQLHIGGTDLYRKLQNYGIIGEERAAKYSPAPATYLSFAS